MKIDMNITYPINFAGYIPVARGILKLISSDVIPLDLLGTYLVFVMQADFDPAHKRYGVILRDDCQIALQCNLSTSTIRRHKQKLIDSGLLTRQGNLISVTNFKLFELDTLKRLIKTPHINYADLYTGTAFINDGYANLEIN